MLNADAKSIDAYMIHFRFSWTAQSEFTPYSFEN